MGVFYCIWCILVYLVYIGLYLWILCILIYLVYIGVFYVRNVYWCIWCILAYSFSYLVNIFMYIGILW